MFNLQNELTIIEFFNEFTKFKNISIKFYFDDDILDLIENDQISFNNNNSVFVFSTNEVFSNRINSINAIISIKRDRDRFRKHLMNVNFCFIMKNSNMKNLIDTNEFFLIKNDHNQFSQYTIFRQKKNQRIVKKKRIQNNQS